MNNSDMWDWNFMWQMQRNFIGTMSPFVMIIVAICVAMMVIGGIIAIVNKARKS